MSLSTYTVFPLESTKYWLEKLVKERKEAGAYRFDIERVEREAASAIRCGFYLVRFSFNKMMEGGVLPFFVEECDDDDTAYVFVRSTGKRPPEGGTLYETEDGHFIQNDFWGDCVRVFQ